MNGLRKLACYNPDIGYSQRAGVPKRFTVKVRISERISNDGLRKLDFGLLRFGVSFSLTSSSSYSLAEKVQAWA